MVTKHVYLLILGLFIWMSAACTPTATLVLDKFGDVDPQFSHFASRAGLAALSETAGNFEWRAVE